jgi:hypothetical protein
MKSKVHKLGPTQEIGDCSEIRQPELIKVLEPDELFGAKFERWAVEYA